jgi:quercetin dioxygenase-like cupin family protein
MDYQFIANLVEELPDIPTDSIISRTIVKNERLNVTMFGFATGQELTEHTAALPAVLHFLDGSAELTLGEDRKIVDAGTWVYMPPNLAHGIKAKTAVTMLLLLLK